MADTNKTSQSSSGTGYAGQQTPEDAGSDFNATAFLIRQMMGQQATAQLVKVLSVQPSAYDAALTGTVSVQIMVNMTDGAGNASPHGEVFNIPYFRLHGGANAVIIDPAVNDIGLAVFCDKDISAVKRTRAVANPGSFRRFSYADGLYLGGFLNGAPTQYVRFTAGGISVEDLNGNTIVTAASGITINGVLFDRDGNVSTNGEVTADGIPLSTHIHGGVQTGGDTTGGPSA